MVIYLLLLGGMALLFIKLPTSFLPQEDRGIFTVQVQLRQDQPCSKPPKW